MIPLRDNIPSRSTPVVNYAVIAACALVFLLQLSGENSGKASLIEQYGMIPQRVFHPGEPVVVKEPVEVQTADGLQVGYRERQAAPAPVNPWLTLLTCVFLHGGWMHLIGNMWFLYIFGDNVEDCLGHVGYLLFYLGCGLAASLTHLLTNAGSMMPTVGASGAIAGVMGAYFLLYPHAKVVSAIPILIFIQIVVLPAPLFLGIWFVFQFLQGTGTVGDVESSGVAWWAHIGGFAAGFAIAALMRLGGQCRPTVQTVRPNTDRMLPPRRGY